MSDTIAKKVKETKQPVEKVKSTEREVTRETRVPLGGFTGPLTLQNQDSNFHYYWEIDSDVNGSKIERRLQAGYVFCRPEENLVVGTTSVYKSDNVGSIIRVPAGKGDYLYLMKIPQEWFEDDQARHAERVNMTEQSLDSKSNEEGFYGKFTVERN